jgi:hypothetical protein
MSSINLGEHQGDGIRYEMYLSAPAGGLAQMIRNPAGNWVGYAEYAALQAENERMRKAGDELARVASYILNTKVKAIEAWHAAKETRP